MKFSFLGFNTALICLLLPSIANAVNTIDLETVIGNTHATSDASIDHQGDSSGSDTPDNYGLEKKDSYAAVFPSKQYIFGFGRCSQNGGTVGTTAATLTDEAGAKFAQYCWCNLTTYSNKETKVSLSGPWVYRVDTGDSKNCGVKCSHECADVWMAENTTYRAAVFAAYAPPYITTQAYVDDAFSRKQPTITTTGVDKLMLYGATAGAILARDIVTTLGASPSATVVPTTGAVLTGVNTKQNAVNGTANYVMTGTGSAGILSEKPVYDQSIHNKNALITAQTVNTAAMDAANSELVCIKGPPEDCPLWVFRTVANLDVCTGQNETCASSDDCCSPLKCRSQTCKSCKAVSAACTLSSECCSGYCANNACALAPDGVICEEADQCASNTCGGLSHTCGKCGGENSSCSQFVSCCSGLTCSNGSCVIACAAVDESCSSDADCCSGLECNAKGLCKSICLAEGERCTNSTECCSGACNSNGKVATCAKGKT